ncbi:TPA: hypothetical protein NGU48_002451 [Vibrio parahaemolyticus]|uniref:hypothetical protein n=1 Tax=Vibrio parahaemolyticus TaxID=670 RepID=UPI001869DCCA|nr:hypothetical protein [Vibrio parahaemolyticus]MBE4291855.1 hypothetical protein [Vibrio parahaemolyticus]MBE4480970.1 hypothetical protein [Vibrio parahaemolyticus]MBE5192477.1 hypothetical protein [Vibrio parahaemolyticus]HCE2386355.1 hypothetical protein [Vibrio parahaemolyticus]HCE2390696.1 hypothetical protein [Vibrio parahaemolyticus]
MDSKGLKRKSKIKKVIFQLLFLFAGAVIGFVVSKYIQFIPELLPLLKTAEHVSMYGENNLANLSNLELKLGAVVLHEYFRHSLYAVLAMLASLIASIYLYYKLTSESDESERSQLSKKLDSKTKDLVGLIEGLKSGGAVLECEYGYQTMIHAIKSSSEIDLVTRMRYDMASRKVLGNYHNYKSVVTEYYETLAKAVINPDITFNRYIQIDNKDIDVWPDAVSISRSLTHEAADLFLNSSACEDSNIYIVPNQIDLSLLLIDKKELFFNFFILLSDGTYSSKYIFHCKSETSKVDSILRLFDKSKGMIELDHSNANKLIRRRIECGDDELRNKIMKAHKSNPIDFEQRMSALSMYV